MQAYNRGLPNQEDVIRRSLARSTAYGVNPQSDDAPEHSRLSPRALAGRIRAQQDFYRLATGQLKSLYGLLRGTGFCMALADAEGYVLYAVGDADLMDYFQQRCCVPGYRWTEQDMGTCTIGLALAERIPVFLAGERMYSTQARKYSNAGAPVFSPDGADVLGAISLSGEMAMMHVHTLGLVRQAAETVTAQLREGQRLRELAIKSRYLHALIDADSRGIVTVDPEGRVVEANHSAHRLLSLPPAVEGRSLADYTGDTCNLARHLAAGTGFQAREILARRSKVTHFASLDPIRMQSGEVVGGLLTVLEKKK